MCELLVDNLVCGWVCVCMCAHFLEAEKDEEEDEEEGKELFFSTIYPRRSVILHFIR